MAKQSSGGFLEAIGFTAIFGEEIVGAFLVFVVIGLVVLLAYGVYQASKSVSYKYYPSVEFDHFATGVDEQMGKLENNPVTKYLFTNDQNGIHVDGILGAIYQFLDKWGPNPKNAPDYPNDGSGTGIGVKMGAKGEAENEMDYDPNSADGQGE